MSWILPALLAPLIWAIVNLIDDNLVRHVYKGAHVGAIISGFFGLIPLVLILLLKDVNIYIPVSLALISLASGFINVIYYYFYFLALQKEHPSIVVALFSLTPALIPFIAYFLLEERLSTYAALGFTLVVVASVIYSMSDVRKFKISSALVPALVAAGIFDVVTIANKYVYNKIDFYQSYLYFSLGMALAGLYFFYVLLFQKNGKTIKAVFKKNSAFVLLMLVLVELLGISAEYVRNFALSLGPVSLVKAFENIQLLYILFISYLFYPLAPKFFPEAKAKYFNLKIAMALVMISGIYVATLR